MFTSLLAPAKFLLYREASSLAGGLLMPHLPNHTLIRMFPSFNPKSKQNTITTSLLSTFSFQILSFLFRPGYGGKLKLTPYNLVNNLITSYF